MATDSERPGTAPRSFRPRISGLLEAPDRDEWQKPDLIMDALRIADGSVVADLGAGGGWFTIRLARRVGPNGVVYAEDIQPPMIEAIGRRVARENLPYVKPLLGTATDPRLPPKLDAVLIAVAYHEMDESDAPRGYRHALRQRGAVAEAAGPPRRRRLPARERRPGTGTARSASLPKP